MKENNEEGQEEDILQINLINPKEFNEELVVKQFNKEYKVEFKINKSEDELTIRVSPNNEKDTYYYEDTFTLQYFQNFSEAFSNYQKLEEIVGYIKNIPFELLEKSKDLTFKFTVPLINSENQLIELNLKRYGERNLGDKLEEIRNDQNPISQLMRENKILKEEIIKLKEDNKVLFERLKRIEETLEMKGILAKKVEKKLEAIKRHTKIPKDNTIDSSILNSRREIEFFLGNIKEGGQPYEVNNIKLLFRGSRDGDRTETCHKLCDGKKRVLIVIYSYTGRVFGGYSSIGFQTSKKPIFKVDNDSFLFSIDKKKIYSVIKDKKAISHRGEDQGLNFYGSISFFDNFMHNEKSKVCGGSPAYEGIKNDYEINAGEQNFRCQDIEVFQIE